MTDEAIGRHLELIQAVVTRMAANSFFLKGWSVTLAAALFAFAAKDSNAKLAMVALIPAVAFWGLDAYYLRQERLFRCLYNQVRRASGGHEPYSMDISVLDRSVPSFLKTLPAPAVAAVHGAVVLAAIAVIVLI